MAWLLPKIWRGIKALARSIARLFGRRPEPATAAASTNAQSGGGDDQAQFALSLPSNGDKPQ